MIRHGLMRVASAVFLLTGAMVLSRRDTVPVTSIGIPVVLQPSLFTASRAAIALSSVAAGADEEDGLAFTTLTNQPPQSDFGLRRHTSSQVGLDNGKASCHLNNQLRLVT